MYVNDSHIDAVVIGASWAGIWTLNLLNKQGLHTKLIDANEDVGGTWYHTSDPELWQEWNWTERFPARQEIQDYLRWVCDKLDIRRHIIFKTTVTAAQWKDSDALWTIETSDGKLTKARFLVVCTGYSTLPFTPRISGQQSFEQAYHSSRFPENLEWKGKRIAIIGTAASGVQCIEAMAPEVSELVVFQRTPNLAMPRRQEQYTDARRAELKRQYKTLFDRRLTRHGFGSFDRSIQHRRTMDDMPEVRERNYERLWQRGGLAFWFDAYSDLLTDQQANREAYNFWRAKTLPRIHKPDLKKTLAPEKPPHAFGTKRPSMETSYFEVFNQPNVSLVDVNQEPIQSMTRNSIRTNSRSFEVDIIIYATGYDYFSRGIVVIDIHGRNDQTLDEKWQVNEGDAGVFTQLGLMTAGFPNMFFLMGPQAPSALGLTPYMAEIQGGWVADCLQYMQAHGKTVIEPTEDAERAWKQEVNRTAAETLFSTTDSWYMSNNIKGRKKEAACYFGGVDRYASILSENAEEGYTGFVLSRR